MELTVSRSFLGVWESLSAAYLAAYHSEGAGRGVIALPAPYTLANHTGYTCAIDLRNSGLQVSFHHHEVSLCFHVSLPKVYET